MSIALFIVITPAHPSTPAMRSPCTDGHGGFEVHTDKTRILNPATVPRHCVLHGVFAAAAEKAKVEQETEAKREEHKQEQARLAAQRKVEAEAARKKKAEEDAAAAEKAASDAAAQAEADAAAAAAGGDAAGAEVGVQACRRGRVSAASRRVSASLI
jgi:hypothetical protein